MLLGNPARNRKAETRAADTASLLRARTVRAVEALEDLALVLLGNADTVIAKRQLHGLFLGQAARGDRDVAAFRRVLDRILEEDAHHLAHRGRIRIDDARLIGLEPQRVLLGDELHLAHGIVDELVEMDILLVQDLALLVGTREEQQFLDKVLHVLGLRTDGRDALLEDLRVRAAPAREKV